MKKITAFGFGNGKAIDIGEWAIIGGLIISAVGYGILIRGRQWFCPLDQKSKEHVQETYEVISRQKV